MNYREAIRENKELKASLDVIYLKGYEDGKSENKAKLDKIKKYINSGNVDDSIAVETINKIINKENL